MNKFKEKGNDIIRHSISKEISIYENHWKMMEDINMGRNKTKSINKNNILALQEDEKENENNKIIQLKKELTPIKSQINIITLEKINKYLYNSLNKNMINNNNFNYQIPYKSLPYIQINDIMKKESQYNKLLAPVLKSLLNDYNENSYLLNFLFPNYYSKNTIFNKSINYIIPEQDKLNERQLQKIKNNNKNNINLIDINSILQGIENRTVVRLHPIPQNYSSFDVSKLIDKYLNIESGKNQRIYKALYVPLSKILGKNIGFCFIMMVEPKYVIKFYSTFNGVNFNKKKSRKPCSVIWADVQGDDFLKISDDPLRSPIIFKDLITKK